MAGRWSDRRAEWELDSPLFQAAQVKAPTLIFAGRNDFLPWQFSQQFHDDINAAGTKADFYVFEREGHGLGWSTSQFVAAQAQIEWFRKVPEQRLTRGPKSRRRRPDPRS